jgi:hypothetical protein
MKGLCALVVVASAACSSSGAPPAAVDAPPADVAADVSVVPPDASTACATSSGEAGDCMLTTACAAIADHVSVAGACPGPTNIQCCVITPSVANNPPIPAGYKLMLQADVTSQMTTWAVAILHDPVTYPMFATMTMTFGALTVLARVEWHPPDFQNSVVHRGVTLYEPA